MTAFFSTIDLFELKLIYRVLHQNLLHEPGLIESEFLQALQSYLQTKARAQGTDTSNHSEWDVWLKA